MTAILFDTLEFADQLRGVGFTDEQARVLTELQRTATDNTLEQARHDYHLDDVATKRDMKELETTLNRDLKELETALNRDLKELETRLNHNLKELETALNHDLKELETKLNHNLKELDISLRHEIELLRADTGRMIAETNQRIAETKAELIRWVVGAGLLQTSLIVGVLMKIAHLI